MYAIFLCLFFQSAFCFDTLEETYSPEYCAELELAYGRGMMSEGGTEAIEHMFENISLQSQKALDIGSGLGGVAFYLAEKYGTEVTGIETNAWMVAESINRTPPQFRSLVNFVQTVSNSEWPFAPQSFDLIYSKGVLTHIENKKELFDECLRLLKPGGMMIITDWLSSEARTWGPEIAKLVELEHLALYPESETGYIRLLENSGFTVLSVRDDTVLYKSYNEKIIRLLQAYKDPQLEPAIEGYQAIANAMATGELRTIYFAAKKHHVQ